MIMHVNCIINKIYILQLDFSPTSILSWEERVRAWGPLCAYPPEVSRSISRPLGASGTGGGGVTGLNTPPWESWPGIPLQCLPSGEPGDWGEVSRGGA